MLAHYPPPPPPPKKQQQQLVLSQSVKNPSFPPLLPPINLPGKYMSMTHHAKKKNQKKKEEKNNNFVPINLQPYKYPNLKGFSRRNPPVLWLLWV